MSSERTQSIVGSEVMPLDYGSMDSESSPSPSSSEKTVEGVRGDEVIEVGEEEVVEVRGNEVVGVGGDSIPITVVEVEGTGERDYDVNVEIVEEVQQYRSELRTRDSLGHLVENYEISSRVLVRLAGVEERACSAPWDHWMPIYSHYLIAGLRFPIPELLVGLLLDYKIGLTQLVPNAMRGGSRRDKGWYYFTSRVANRESRSLFTAGPSSIKGWKEKFFFADDTEWGKGDAEVRELSSWKAKRANQNRFSLNEDEEEEVRKLVRKRGDLLNIMDLTSAQCIEAAELYGPSALSEAEMDQFLNTAGGAAIPKKPRKKSKTSTKQVDEGRARKEVVPTTSAEAEEEVPQLKRKGWEERRALQKKQKVVEEEERGEEVPQFVPQPSHVELNPELRQLKEGAEVRAPGKGKALVPPLGPHSSLFEAKNMTGARWFINSTFPEVDRHNTRDEALRYGGASVVKHILESASWVNGLAQEFRESLKERSLLQRQCEQLQNEKEDTFPEVDRHNTRDEALRYGGASVVKHVLENASWVNGLAQEFRESLKERSLLQRQCEQLQKEKEELEKRNKELQESLNEVVPAVKQLEQERASLSTKLVFEESKRRISESEREAQAQELKLTKKAFLELKENVQTLVHNGMKEHINNFINSSSFDNIVNLYRLPTAIIAFTDCRKKVKAEYPKVDITKITFGEQEEGVEEDSESMSTDFCPQINLRWEHDANGRAVFPPQFDFEFVAMEEEGAEVEGDEVEAGVEGAEVDESQPVPEVEIHPVPFDDEQPPLPDE
ncbi:hypothetical protein SLEP1_g28781 [Rubroshorea leprosula]|uniref:Transposase (Putative), gypsy type n=1 Tax=Rubroshorea leprosula TaxID=152421 RepID=A0AAV5K5E7_9ROSI|nr:hypothetical protein SLEP1_g28781 [Rubroshorea leprosula]